MSICFLIITSNALAEWVRVDKDGGFSLGLNQEWNLPPLKDEFYSILMTRHHFEISQSGMWKPIWEWCSEEFTNRCEQKDKKWIAKYVNIYKIDCFATSKKFQIINSYWLGLKGEELSRI